MEYKGICQTRLLAAQWEENRYKKTMAICIVCKGRVTPKTGIQCQGSCSVWVHYGCLDYVTDDGRKMVHEPYSNSHMYSDVCVVTQLNDTDTKIKWNNNYDSINDHYVSVNETASQVTQETATKSVSQGASIYKSLSLGMFGGVDTAFNGYSLRPYEYIPCGRVPHILLPMPYPIQYPTNPTANQYNESASKIDAEKINERNEFHRMDPHETPRRESFCLTSTATETDDYAFPFDLYYKKFPAVPYYKRNTQSRTNISNFEYLRANQHPQGYRSSIPLYQLNSQNIRHVPTEVNGIDYINSYDLIDYINFKQRKSNMYYSKSITTVDTDMFENVYARKLVSTINLLSLSDSSYKIITNDTDALRESKYNVASMQKWMISSLKKRKKKEMTTPSKNKSVSIGHQGSELSDILEKPGIAVTEQAEVNIKQSVSAPISANPQAAPPAVHLRTSKSVALVTDEMVENVPLEAECQTSKTQSFTDAENYAVVSTNTSFENSIETLLSKAVGTNNSKVCSPIDIKIGDLMKIVNKRDAVKKEGTINNSLENMKASTCLDAPTRLDIKYKDIINKKYENISTGHSMTNIDAAILPDKKSDESLHKKCDNLSAKHMSWTKLDESTFPNEISMDPVNKMLGKLVPDTKSLDPEEKRNPSADNVLTSCLKNVLSTFEMLSSQICEIFNSRKKENVACNYCSTVRSEATVSLVHSGNSTSKVFDEKQECLTVKLLNFQNDSGN